jgi:hypothetical protein
MADYVATLSIQNLETNIVCTSLQGRMIICRKYIMPKKLYK